MRTVRVAEVHALSLPTSAGPLDKAEFHRNLMLLKVTNGIIDGPMPLKADVTAARHDR